jgi:hypothetical protein
MTEERLVLAELLEKAGSACSCSYFWRARFIGAPGRPG